MKTMQKYAFLFAVAAMGFTACSKEEIDEVRNEPTFTLSIEASADETRSSFGELTNNAYLSSWSGTETVCFYLGTTGSTATPSAAGPSATFKVTFSGTVPASGTVYALSPVGDYQSTPKKGGFTSSSPRSDESSYVVIPAVQTPLEGSCDESVHLLAAAQEFTGSIENPLKMHFSHAAAYGRMKITGFNGTIKSVTIDSPVGIVGNSCHYKYKEGVFENVTDKTLTLNADNVVDNVFWFGCAPAELNSGEMTVTVTDDADKRYVKTIPLSADKHINLTHGRIASFSVNMTGIEAEQDVQLIADGDYVIAITETYNQMMIVGDPTAGYRDKRNLSTETIDGKLAVDADALWTITYNGNEQYTIKSYSENTYISYGSNTAPLNTDPYLVKIESVTGGYNIIASNHSDRYLAYNTSSPRFGFYTSQQRTLQIIPAFVDTTPTISVDPAELTFPAAGGDQTINVTLKNSTEAITAESDNAQFSVAVAGNVITVTAAENTTAAEITGTITVKAGTLSATVAVKQVAAGASVPKYVKVTSAPADWSGTYLIVYEESAAKGKVFNNVDASSGACIDATIDNYTIAVTSELEAEQVVIAPMDGGYSIHGRAGYISGKSGGNDIVFNVNDQQLNTIQYDSNNSVKITSNTSVFRYNTSGRFRYYQSTTYTDQQPIQLYKLEN